MPARRTEPTAWLCPPSARHATALKYVNAVHTDLRATFARWHEAHRSPLVQVLAPTSELVITLHRSQRP
jgi:hypothetical protein